MTTDAKFSKTGSFKAAMSAGNSADSQHLTRGGLITAAGSAIEFARLSQRFVGLLVVQLIRPDRLEAIVGTPTAEVTKSAMQRLTGTLRTVDRLVAVSEDKIIILLPNLKSTAQASLAADKIQNTLEQGFSIDGEQMKVRPLVGIAIFPDHAELPEELIVHADIAVAVAAKLDASQHVFQNEDRRDSDVYLGMDATLIEAIRTNQLELYFQPQTDLKTGKCVAAEVLLGWNAPDYGQVSPATIIRIAEVSGALGALTNWVVNATLRQHAEWLKRGIRLNVSINLSTVNLQDTELPDAIKQAIGTWGVDPACITFEITENATIGDTGKSVAVLGQLKDIGVRIAVDDFGTGYSSLSYLKSFPLDELKIDEMFIKNMRQSVPDQKIVRSIVDLAHSFGLKIVAEGVEDEATVRDLKKMGCDMVQGNVLSPALPPMQFVEWFAAHNK
ncbi:MAG: GGDEF domain-containing phosphodiesterase [Pseudomonadota bacterium]